MPHCCKCGCLGNVGESVICEACVDNHAMVVAAMKSAIDNSIDYNTGKRQEFFHRDMVNLIIKELS